MVRFLTDNRKKANMGYPMVGHAKIIVTLIRSRGATVFAGRICIDIKYTKKELINE
jgi:hypothetical protein